MVIVGSRHSLHAGFVCHWLGCPQHRQPDVARFPYELHHSQYVRRDCARYPYRNSRQRGPPSPSAALQIIPSLHSGIYSVRLPIGTQRGAPFHLRLGRHQLFGDRCSERPRQLVSARRRSQPNRAAIPQSGNGFLFHPAASGATQGFGSRSCCCQSPEFTRTHVVAHFPFRRTSSGTAHLLPQTASSFTR